MMKLKTNSEIQVNAGINSQINTAIYGEISSVKWLDNFYRVVIKGLYYYLKDEQKVIIQRFEASFNEDTINSMDSGIAVNESNKTTSERLLFYKAFQQIMAENIKVDQHQILMEA